MKDFLLGMKIAIAQSNYHIGNFEGNYEKIKSNFERAKADGAHIVMFPELALTGYPPRDFLEFDDFINCCLIYIDKIAKDTAGTGTAVIVGAPEKNPKVEGKDLYNAAYFIADGEVKHIVRKALLPNYDIFDEYRYFEPGTIFDIIEYKGKRIALTICEDLWNIGNENPMYITCPMDQLKKQEPDFIANIAASPFDYFHSDDRIDVLKANTERYNLPILYVNHVGAQTEIIFDGGSLAINDKGVIVEELPYFEEAYRVFDLNDLYHKNNPVNEDNEQPKQEIQLIHDALIVGIQNYFRKLGFKKAILGLSGGIDSTVVLALAAEALGPENVRAILMPSEFSSQHSVDDSVVLAQNLRTPYDTIPIKEVYDAYIKVLNPYFEGKEFDVTEENIQARIRGNYLMALSNKFGYILLNTSNKSEAAVGYGTLYGDMAGGISVIGDVYKMQVYDLARYINRNGEIIPTNIITKAPSAELRPGQTDQDSLPPYDVLDKILFQYIEKRKGPKEIVKMGFEETTVARILKMVNTNEYKRHQMPPVLRVSPKAFGMGRRLPLVGRYLS